MIRRLATLVFTLACVSHSQAGIVTFDTMGGPFTSGTEDGFSFTGTSTTVSNAGGLSFNWVGNSAPRTTSVLTFFNGGVFTFTSVDIGRIIQDPSLPPVQVTGYRDGNQVGVDIFPVLMPAGVLFTFSAGHLAGQVLDRLTITFVSSRLSPTAIDNVTFGEASLVPEPATLALSGVGILVAVAHARRRRAANA